MKKLVPKAEKPLKKPKISKTGVKNRPKKSVSEKTSATVWAYSHEVGKV